MSSTSRPRRILAGLTAIAMLLQSAPALAQIVADPNAPGAQRATVLTAGNGIPLVNIQTPNAAGLSRNAYRQFDVQSAGAILNNARSASATQLGGGVSGNPWLAAGSARTILSEVNSSHPSRLNGPLEVAGSAAQVIIANPSGISCTGCGFINANQVTLTTGQPLMNGDRLAGYRVNGGVISVAGDGLNAAAVDFTSLIARAVSLNAGLWAQRLAVTTGVGDVSADGAVVTPRDAASAGAAPQFAIDVAQLGGMYAHKITLIGSEYGVGARNAGSIAAVGEVGLTVDGRIVNQGLISAGAGRALAIVAAAIDNSGTLNAAGDVRLSSRNDIANRGLINADRELLVSSAGALVNAGGTLAGARLEISAESLTNSTGSIRQTGLQAIALAADRVLNHHGGLIGNVPLSVNGRLNVSANGAATPTTAPGTASGGVINVSTAAPAAEGLADGRIAVRGALTNDGGQITGNGRFDALAANGLGNHATLNLATLTVGGRFDNSDGTIGASLAQITSATLDNTRGAFSAGAFQLGLSDLINTGGQLTQTGGADLVIDLAGSLDNRGGTISHAGSGTLALTVGQTLDNRVGQLLSANDAAIAAGRLNNVGGIVYGGHNVVVASEQTDNSGGQLTAKNDLIHTQSGAATLGSAGIQDAGAQLTVSSGGGFTFAAADRLTAGKQARLSAAGNLVSSGQWLAGEALRVSAADLTLQSGSQASADTLSLAARGVLAGDAATVVGDEVTLSGARIDLANASQIASNGATVLTASDGPLVFTDSTLESIGALTLSSRAALSLAASRVKTNASATLSAVTTISTQGAEVVSGGLLTASAQALDNRGGRLSGAGGLTLTAATLDNRERGQMLSGKDADLTASDSFNNAGGTVEAANHLALATLSYTGPGTLIAGGNLSVQLFGDYTQAAGNVFKANHNIDLWLTGKLTNWGTFAAVNDLSINAAALSNEGSGELVAGHSLQLTTAGELANRGTISAPTLLLQSGTLTNTGALFGNDLSIRAGQMSNRDGGVVAAANALDLYVSDRLSNVDDGLLYSAGRLAIAGGAGRDADGWLNTPANAVLNSSAVIEAAGKLEINAHTIDNQRTRLVMTSASLGQDIQLVQEVDEGWGGAGAGLLFPNASTMKATVVTTRCYALEVSPCTTTTSVSPVFIGGTPTFIGEFAPTTTERSGVEPEVGRYTETISTRYVLDTNGADAWYLAAAASIPTFTVLNWNGGGRRYTVVNDYSEQQVVSATAEGRILSGGDMWVSGTTLTNTASRVEAAGNQVSRLGVLNNTGYTLTNTTRSTRWTGQCSDIKSDLPGSLGHCASGWIWTANVTDTLTGSNGSLDSVYRGGKSLTIGALTINNTTVDANGLTPGGINLVLAPPPRPLAAANVSGDGGAALLSATQGVTDGLFRVPTNRLYQIHPGSTAHYLVEADRRFTPYGDFVSSDVQLSQLVGIATLKRLGDGFYEQQLLSEQLIALTGSTQLAGYADRNAEYRALLDAGVDAASDFGFTPGLTLSRDQVALLTQNIVWMETRIVAGETVLVPVVYLAGNAARDRQENRLDNRGGVIGGGGALTRIVARDINNRGTLAGETVELIAANDINTISGRIRGRDITLAADHDIVVGTHTEQLTFSPGQVMTREGLAGRIDGERVALMAGRDITFAGGVLTATGDAALVAGRDLTVGTQTLTTERHLQSGSSRYDDASSVERGSRFDVGGDLGVVAGRDLGIVGSALNADGRLAAQAGRDLSVSASKDVAASQFHAQHARGGADTTAYSETVTASTLAAGGDLALIAGNAIGVFGSRVDSRGNATLQAGGEIIVASVNADAWYNDNVRGKRSLQQSSEQRRSVSASVVKAGGDLTLNAGGNTTVHGSALDAGHDLTLQTGGDLNLLAATSTLERTSQTQNTRDSLEFEMHQTRQLLSTLSAGHHIDLHVGGKLTAQTGTRAADGTLQADRMTASGVVQGSDRQQVSVSGAGAGQSKVLGDLSAQGIRNGANDSFDAPPTLSGPAAMQALLDSQLIEIRNTPALAGLLTPDGTAPTYQDATGAVKLTVAGQARVEALYNQLRLTETYTRHANPATAQIVTLVTAIALTVCTGGAGTGTLGATLSTAGSASAAMINAAVIGMASTMTGQLAGGASLAEAFQAGVKAGTTSAFTAGVAYGVNDALGLNPVGYNAEGVAQYSQEAQNYFKLPVIDKLGTSTFWTQTGVNATASGVLATAQGGSFKDGAVGSVIGSLAASGAGIIGDYGASLPAASVARIAAHAVLGCASAAAGGQDCAAGAVGGATSATLAQIIDGAVSTSDLSDTTKRTIIAGGSVVGSMAVASALGKDVNTAGNAASNEVLNNDLYHYKGKIVAYDNIDNSIIIELSDNDVIKLAAANPEVLMQIVVGVGKQSAPILVLDSSAQLMTSRRIVDLNTPVDREQLAKDTDMGYINLTDQNTRIYLQTGMKNSPADAVKSAQALSELLGRPVGVINNGTEGLAGDVGEYLPNSLNMKDVLNEYTLRSLNAKGPTLIVTHSAGNEDARKALNIGALYGHQYDNLSFLSLASPVGVNPMQAATRQSHAQFLGQIRDWRDPVTYSKTAGAVSIGSFVGGLFGGLGYGAVQGCAAGAGFGLLGCVSGGITGAAAGAVGGAAAGGAPGIATYFALKNYHPFEQYLAKPQVQSILFDWLKANPAAVGP